MRETVHSLLPQIYPRIYQHSNNEKRKPIINQIHFPFRARSRSPPQLPPLHPPTFEPTIQKKEKKKETNYVPSNRHTHPKSPFILLLIPFSDLSVYRLVSSITTATVSTTVETPWTQPSPEEILPYHSFSPFPQNINGHRPFEFNRFNPRKKKLAAAPPVSRTRNGSFPCGKRVRGGPRAASWCALRTPKPPPLSLFFGCTRRRHRYFSRKKGRRWDKGG